MRQQTAVECCESLRVWKHLSNTGMCFLGTIAPLPLSAFMCSDGEAFLTG